MSNCTVDAGHEVFRTTPCGRIRGTRLSSGSLGSLKNSFGDSSKLFQADIFHGIPYAKTLRFEMPVLVHNWSDISSDASSDVTSCGAGCAGITLDADGTLDATTSQSEIDCWQFSSFYDESAQQDTFYYKEFRSERTFRYAESPMTLNIVCPSGSGLEVSGAEGSTAGIGCPVVIFFHGGGHETGTVGELPYGTCTEYAKRGVVFVSVGYRLNVFNLYRGMNYGLHDQIAAIHWVRANIAAFGGNPEQIVLMGQSAGAMSITALCMSQKLKGLVKGAVLMSGGGCIPKLAGPWPKEKCDQFWDGVRSKAGATSEKELREIGAEELWRSWQKQTQEGTNFHLRQPAIDGDIVPDFPQKVLKCGLDLDIPLIFGVTAQDFLPVIMYEMALSWGKRNARMRRAPVYGYMVRRTPPGNCYKAFHGIDLWYMFGNLDKSWRPFEPQDYELSARMIDYVAAFARTGDPNGGVADAGTAGVAATGAGAGTGAGTLPYWPAISSSNSKFMCFDVGPAELLTPHQCRKLVWHTALRDKGPL